MIFNKKLSGTKRGSKKDPLSGQKLINRNTPRNDQNDKLDRCWHCNSYYKYYYYKNIAYIKDA